MVVIDSASCSYSEIFAESFQRLGIDHRIIQFPSSAGSRRGLKELHHINKIIKSERARGPVIFCPGVSELFLAGADRLLVFSGYRAWARKEGVVVLPHPWSLIAPADRGSIGWSSKPPLVAGFMGTGYLGSRLARMAMMAPMAMKRRLLEGHQLRFPAFNALLNGLHLPLRGLNTFPRLETIELLQRHSSRLQTDVVAQGGFAATAVEKDNFVQHLIRNTYIVCPRGYENFSFRVYEALRYGRVPVIIDTDMMMPEQVPWDRVAIRISYEKLPYLQEIIAEDYHSKNASEFIERQGYAFRAIDYLDGMSWLDKLLLSVCTSS